MLVTRRRPLSPDGRGAMATGLSRRRNIGHLHSPLPRPRVLRVSTLQELAVRIKGAEQPSESLRFILFKFGSISITFVSEMVK